MMWGWGCNGGTFRCGVRPFLSLHRSTNPTQYPRRRPHPLVAALGDAGRLPSHNLTPLVAWESWLPPAVLKALRSHQEEAVAHCIQCLTGTRSADDRGAVIAFSMGLGKTMITLAVITALLNAPPVFQVHRVAIVCPASLTANWAAEVEKWLPPSRVKFLPLSCRADMVCFAKHSPMVVIASYETWVALRGVFEQNGQLCDLLVVDEAHRCVSVKSDIHQSLLTIPTPNRLLLTGTPMRNDQLHNYYHLLDLACPGSFGSEAHFRRSFVEPIASMGDGPDEEARGRRTALRLQRKAAFVLHKGEEFLQQFLPPLHEVLLVAIPTPMQVQLLQHLQRFRNLTMNDLEDGRSILACPSLLVAPRWDSIKRTLEMPHCWTVDVYQSHSGALAIVCAIVECTMEHTMDKLVISSYRLEELNLIQKLVRLMRIPGGATLLKAGGTDKSRQAKINAFNDKNDTSCRILLLPGLSGGVGINLVGANRMLMLGSSWDPTCDLQLARRVWRPGQLSEVFVWRVVTRGCLDERVFERGLEKEHMRLLVHSAGNKGNAGAAAQSAAQHDKIARLLYAPEHAPTWKELPPDHPALSDIPTLRGAKAGDSKLYCLSKD